MQRRENTVKHTMKYTKYYYPEMPLTRMAHKSDKTGTPSKMHPRINTRAHLSVIQKKTGLREPHLGSADPMGRPTPYWA